MRAQSRRAGIPGGKLVGREQIYEEREQGAGAGAVTDGLEYFRGHDFREMSGVECHHRRRDAGFARKPRWETCASGAPARKQQMMVYYDSRDFGLR